MVYLTQLVYLHDGREAMSREFEDVVLPLLAKHRGELLLRLRLASQSKVAGSQSTLVIKGTLVALDELDCGNR